MNQMETIFNVILNHRWPFWDVHVVERDNQVGLRDTPERPKKRGRPRNDPLTTASTLSASVEEVRILKSVSYDFFFKD